LRSEPADTLSQASDWTLSADLLLEIAPFRCGMPINPGRGAECLHAYDYFPIGTLILTCHRIEIGQALDSFLSGLER
jgi:hypothetical protein